MTGRALARLLALAASLAAGCSLRAPHLTEVVCSQDKQCGAGQVCFAGECRSPASALGAVMVEVTPPTNSPYASVQRSFDLRASAVGNIELPLPSRVQGTLLQNADADAGTPDAGLPVAGASLSFADTTGLIPGRALTVSVQTDSSGAFAARLAPATWSLRITPPAPLPPFAETPVGPDAQDLSLRLPAAGALTRIAGTLKSAGQPLPYAHITPVSRQGDAVGALASSDAQGHFSLLLPPAPVEYGLRISGDAPDGGLAAVSDAGPLPSFQDTGFGTATASTGAVDLDVGALPAPAVLAGRVVDAANAPVANARVTASNIDAVPWVLTRSTTTASDGTFSLALREGSYLLEAAPALDPAQPALSGTKAVTVKVGGPDIVVTCPPKVRANGRVLRSNGGSAGAGVTITATRLPDRLVSGRAATTTQTDAYGAFTLVGDPGTYRLEIAPPAESNDARQIAFIDLNPLGPLTDTAQPLPPLGLPPPLVVVGTVTGPAAASVAGATVAVYAVSSSGDSAVFLGGAVTSSDGRYRLVLPDVSEPTTTEPFHSARP
jgi:Cys-rich repeat protein